MWKFSLAFLAGILSLQQFGHLPSIHWLWLIASLSIIFYYKKCRVMSLAFIGFGYCLGFAHLQTSWHLSKYLEGKDVSIQGWVHTIPVKTENRTTFLFKIDKLVFNHEVQKASGLLHLSWQDAPPEVLHAGDKWHLAVRLKEIHGVLNPGGFDYEAWALQEGIIAKGYVAQHKLNQLVRSDWYIGSLNRIREKLKNQIENHLVKTNTSPWIVALTVGERNNIPAADWEVLRNTGTNHLMAIAGLHIGFMSGLTYAIVSFFWRRISWLTLRIPAQYAGAVGSLIMTLIYSAMAGFSIPAQRASIMLTIFLLVVLCRKLSRAWQAWSIGLFFVLLINPLCVLTESFWLSFGAVAYIIYGISARLAPTGWWWKLGRIQWVIAFGLIPFSIWLFQEFLMVSFIANSIAIPLVAFLIVPLSLLGTFLLLVSSGVGAFVLSLADKTLGVLWVILSWFAHLPAGTWYGQMPNLWVLGASCVGAVLLLSPIGFKGCYLGFIGFLPLFFYSYPKPQIGELWLTTLDVGQGLSIVLQTSNHALIFDAGPKLGDNFDAGESIVLPFLRAKNIKKIDILIISHGDNDHIGGAAAILKKSLVLKILTSVPNRFVSQATYCLRGEAWRWDGVDFKILYPEQDSLELNNNSSCVLQITTGNKRILLTGDIEKFAEHKLVQLEGLNLKSAILVAPHHGSKTSAEKEFLKLVHPDYVVFALGYRNRYHFPHSSVIAKYDALGTNKIDTASAGAIQFNVSPRVALLPPIQYRLSHHHYWNS